MPRMYRQGDVVFVKLGDAVAKSVQAEFKKPHDMVLKEGEQTGHKHEAVGTVEVFAPHLEGQPWSRPFTRDAVRSNGLTQGAMDTMLYLTANGQFKVVHPEHGTLVMEKGNYLVFSQREYDETRDRQVID